MMASLKAAIRPAVVSLAVFVIFSSACAIPHIVYISDRPHPRAFEWWIALLPEHNSIFLAGFLLGATTFIWTWKTVISNAAVATALAATFIAWSLWITSLEFMVIITGMRLHTPTLYTERTDDIVWPLLAATLLILVIRNRHNKARISSQIPPRVD